MEYPAADAGMPTGVQVEKFERLLELLDSQGCLGDVVVIGSWAEFAWMFDPGIVARGIACNIRTLDIDILVKNLRRPSEGINLPRAAGDAGYEVMTDYMNGATKLVDADADGNTLEVEFLLGKVGAGREDTLRTNLGVTAETLRHTELLRSNTVTVRIGGHGVSVPTPEAYVLHKMIINGERGRKAEKDRAAVARLWPHLDGDEFGRLLGLCTKKERARALAFIADNGLDAPEARQGDER